MATAQPAGQARNAFGRDHGNYATVATMPNGSGNVLPSATVPLTLEAGDRCYLVQSSTTGLEYICVSAGTSGGGNAVWVPNTGIGPWSSVLYVDNVRGNDTTGRRGINNLPFATIQAAFNVAQTDDVVQLAAQVHAPAAAITVPATVVQLTVVGTPSHGGLTNSSGTLILQTGAPDIFDLGANLGLSRFQTIGCNVTAFTGSCFKADGTAYATGLFLSAGLVITNCEVAGLSAATINATFVRSMTVSGGLIQGARSTLVNCGRVIIAACMSQSHGFDVSFDADNAKTPNIFGTTPFNVIGGSVIGGNDLAFSTTTIMRKQTKILVDETSTLYGLTGTGLNVSAGNVVPSVTCRGYIGGGNSGVVDFATAGHELPDTAVAMTWDFRGTRFYANGDIPGSGPTAIKFKVGGAAGNFQTVKLDSTVTLPAVTFTADAKIHLTMRGADDPQPVYATPGADGDIIPPMLTGTVDVSAGGAVAKTWVQLGYPNLIRTGASPDSVFLTPSAQLSDPALTGKSTTTLTITSNVIAGDSACNWLAVWK